MLIDEFFGEEKKWWDTKILATDISGRVVETAKNGVYSQQAISKLNPIWHFNYFRKVDDKNFVVTDSIKKDVIFRKFNLIEREFPFKRKFHVIFCRNVMIYFDSETKRDLIRKFYDSLEYGGYLFIGHTEYIRYEETKFRYIRPAVYRKI